MRERLKALAGACYARIDHRCRFDRAIFLIGHMRAASTALSSVLCSHPEITGFGEAHIRYAGRGSLGVLALSTMKNHTLKTGSAFLFDKILHNGLDDHVNAKFFRSRAIFLCRAPADSIPSINRLFGITEGGTGWTLDACADYYESRLERILQLYDMFDDDRRIGLTTDQLLSDPEVALGRLSDFLPVSSPIENAYDSSVATPVRRGSGDPITARFHSSIRRRGDRGTERPAFTLRPERMRQLSSLYDDYVGRIRDAATPSRRLASKECRLTEH